MTRLAAAKPLADMTEQEWDGQLFRAGDALAKMLGWTSFHVLRSRGSRAGFPDRAVWRDRLLFAELKTEKGKPTPLQVETLDGLARAGSEVYLWRPSDLEEAARVLGKPWRFFAASREERERGLPSRLCAAGEPFWTPGSLWIPGRGRADG